MKVLIYLQTNPQQPIEANIPNYNATEFTSLLNGNLLFIELGGNIISRNMIMMITPETSPTTED